jgi:hypothetical protein
VAGSCEIGNETLGSLNILGIFRVAKELLHFEGGLGSMKLVSQLLLIDVN